MHLMRLHPGPFEKFRRGTKTLEMRLNDAKRRRILVGEQLCVESRLTGEQLVFEVVQRHEYATFDDMIKAHALPALGYEGDTLERLQAGDHGLYEYYTPDDEARWGVVALEVRPVD